MLHRTLTAPIHTATLHITPTALIHTAQVTTVTHNGSPNTAPIHPATLQIHTQAITLMKVIAVLTQALVWDFTRKMSGQI